VAHPPALKRFYLSSTLFPTLMGGGSESFRSAAYEGGRVVMPMMTDRADEQARVDRQAKTKAEQPAEGQPKFGKRNQAKQPVTV